MPTGPHRASSIGTVASRNYSHPASVQLQSTSGRKTGTRSSRVQKPLVAGKATSSTAYRGLFYPETASSAIKATEEETGASISRLHVISQPLRTSGKATALVNGTDEESQASLSRAKSQKRNKSSSKVEAHEQTRLIFMDKALPDTPTSAVGTPTELLERTQSPPSSMLRNTSQKPQARRRSPLAQIPETDAKSNCSMSPKYGAWPGHLPAIPEHTASEEKIAVMSGVSTPVATQMHLRGGSVVTVCPPESNPWQRSVYIQGPIKLPKPAIVPRKNSLASLEPFQEAIDQMYQDALYIPRRRSDDRVLDDVCDFFDEFGFEAVAFLGDITTKDYMEVDDAAELGHSELERFSTPPAEPEVSPIERTVARDIIEKLSPSSTALVGDTSGLQSGATEPCRASQPRKDSTTLSRFDTGASRSIQTPKEALKDSRYPHALTKGNSKKTAQPPDDPRIAVEELDASSEWIAPALFKRVWSKQNILREKSFHRKLAA